MSLLTRKSTILAKIEGTYATDPTPTGSANAILVGNLTVTPLDADLVERPIIKPFLGNADKLIAESRVKIQFDVEMAGAGVPGIAPGYAPLLKACAFAEDLNTAAVTISSVTTTATVTETAHGRSNGSYVKISGATETEYNGNFVIAVTGANTYTYTMLSDPAGSSATGSPVVGIDAQYAPVSESFDSITIYYNNDGVLHKATGSRGTVKFGLNVKQIPVMTFIFTALYNSPSDTAAPTVDYDAFLQPKIANTANTTDFSLHGFSGYLQSMEFDMANDVQFRTLIGYQSVNIIDRKPAGTFVLEAPTMADKNFFDAAIDGDVDTMSITHGNFSGNIIMLDAPRVSIQNPNYQDSQGVQMLSIPFTATPDSGNDELLITVK